MCTLTELGACFLEVMRSTAPDDRWPREMRKRVSEVTGSSKVVSDENGYDLGTVERIPASRGLVSADQPTG
jgi:hypothetical protein